MSTVSMRRHIMGRTATTEAVDLLLSSTGPPIVMP